MLITNNQTNNELKSDEQVIDELREFGIKIIYKPMALVPNTLESPTLMGNQSHCVVEMDIHYALNKIKIRKKVIGDPFS
jgi:hypothetical protein